MKQKLTVFLISLFALVASAVAQGVPPPVAMDPNTSMAYDMNRIAASVQTMTKTLKDFVDKFAKAEGISISEKQAKLVIGMQILVQAEQRAAVFQRNQIELFEKEAQLRTKLSQVELELNQQVLDRSVAFEGSTQTPEIKENRRRALQAERASLQNVLQQLQSSIREGESNLREAQQFVLRLRRAYLPQVEKELNELYQ